MIADSVALEGANRSYATPGGLGKGNRHRETGTDRSGSSSPALRMAGGEPPAFPFPKPPSY
jgi:hypothetical protein